MDFLKTVSLAEAREIVKANVKPGRTEEVPLLDAVGRVIAQDVVADIDVAPFDDSAMDGFAVIAADLENASEEAPVSLECVGHIGAGAVFEGELQRGQCIRIMTGAPIPAGVDAVVKIEIVEFEGEGSIGSSITFKAPCKLGGNIRKAGEEAKKGDVVLKAGDVLSPAGAGLLATVGCLNVAVYARPRVAILSIGSELVDATEVPGPGQIRDSDRWSLAASVADAGGIPVLLDRVSDDAESITRAYENAAAEYDMVVSSGGACMGDFDLTPGIVAKLGQLHFTRTSMKPGKSQPFGQIGDTPVFVLSGNPSAATIGCEVYVRLALRIMQGYSKLDRPVLRARLTEGCRKKEPRLFLQRGTVMPDPENPGCYLATQHKKQSSGLFGALQASNCLIVIPEGLEQKQEGDLVDCILTHVSEDAF